MRLLKYLSFSSLPQDVNVFRALTIKMNESPKDYSKIVSYVQEHYDIPKIQPILDKINKELKIVYNGKYTFSLCLSEGVSLDIVRLNSKYLPRLKTLLYESNNQLSKIKEKIELKP